MGRKRRREVKERGHKSEEAVVKVRNEKGGGKSRQGGK